MQGRGWIDKVIDNGLGGKQSGGCAKGGKKTKENPSGLLGPSGGFSNFGIESQKLNFFKRVGSSRLTSGAANLRSFELPASIMKDQHPKEITSFLIKQIPPISATGSLCGTKVR